MAFHHKHFFISFFFLSFFILPTINTLSTVSISQTSNSNQTLICVLQHQNQKGHSNLNCTSFPPSTVTFEVNPNVSFSQIVGGNGFVCALTSSSFSSSNSIMVCWRFSNASTTKYKRIYHGPFIQDIDSGNSHVCGLVKRNNGFHLECWQWNGFINSSMNMNMNMLSIAVGENFVCGILEKGNVTCIGSNNRVVGNEPKSGRNYSVIEAGSSHVCAISIDGSLDCWGDMVGEKPKGRFIGLALGDNRSCALGYDGIVTCWGSNNFTMPLRLKGTFFESIVAKKSVFCGVLTSNYSLFCWGSDEILKSNNALKVFDNVLPGPCKNECPCGPLSDSAKLCVSPAIICKPCLPSLEFPSNPSSSPIPKTSSKSGTWSNKMVAFLVIGCVGCSSLLLVLSFFLYKYCKSTVCRVHDSGRLDDPEIQTEPQGPIPNATLEKRLSHVISMGNGGTHLEEYSLQTLIEATNDFSQENKIGVGSFGSVYHAKLEDGKEVAIKRAEMSSTSASCAVLGVTKRQEDKDSAFINELESLSRLHHKNLVKLLGFYEDKNERILVYEYMNNGSLNDHLHKLQTSSSTNLMSSWSGRIKVALDAARGIEYLHQYVTPSIIHRDIKSSNILLDSKWVAKVSDFGLSLMGPNEDEESHLSLLAAGTVGYMDPEYYRLQHLTTKSDVYSFGVVLLEILSGYKAIHKNENGVPRNVVDFVVPFIVQDEIHRVLDPKMPPPTPFEIEGVAFVGYLACDCVRLEGRDRPNMSHVVNSLETALAACLAQPIVLSRSTTITVSSD
ncbi:serine/threonine-protein kinase-like protein CCR4 [Cicer arietinum]|uniref:Serine/threonine-protein kinase-like protein CCR4 n=1 Tax=Cicer arietinum TaxID=3827 RepID=A0A1S2YL10_CICAR|nr:serine/threonine-protein kinase-like protein CCR4 [Cicer arietinum]